MAIDFETAHMCYVDQWTFIKYNYWDECSVSNNSEFDCNPHHEHVKERIAINS